MSASEPVSIKLVHPIKAHGEEVSELVFREPTGEEIMQIGSPQLLIPSADGESVGIEIRAKIIGQYIVRLAGVPLSSVKSMKLSDFNSCQGVIMGFFGNGGGEA